MARRDRLSKLKAAARAQLEAEGLEDAEKKLRPWDVRLAVHAKRGTRVLVTVTGLITAAATLAGTVVQRWRAWRAGPAVAPAELPRGSGVPSVATEFVKDPRSEAKPSKPGEGS